eukprot:scaffold3240_cov187-Amphora_coffeaeformis.AAC.15
MGQSDHDENQDKVIVRGTEQDDFPEEFWQDIEAGKPSEWAVMKELLGINIFTYILAAAITFFLSMNVIFGQGWLGSAIGIQGTGTFTERSETLPNVVDLSEDQFSI